jgi:murein DD-endopeptidase MepM/ murein hydrolase activator NlpD
MRSVLLVVAILTLPLSAAPSAESAGARSTIASTRAESSTPPWSWPVAGAHVVVRPYLAPATDYGPGHRGVDLAADGTRVLAPADGVVSYAGVVVDRGVLSIAHSEGVVSSYEPVTTELRAGDVVHRGQLVATLDAGHCSEPCVHLGVRIDGRYVSPMLFLGEVPRSVLLPTRPIG